MKIKKENYLELIDKDKYQVFLFKSKANLPFCFASHTYFVLNKKGIVSRWEIAHTKKFKAEKSWGHLYKNLYQIDQGLEIFPYFKKFFWKSHLIHKVEGENINQIIDFVENSPEKYKFCYKYHFLGPNSNTYTQWIINNFPKENFKLPNNAYGKNYDYEK